MREVTFCGVDEVAEIAYLSLQETGLQLARVVDTEPAHTEFFGKKVDALTAALQQPVVITSLKRSSELRQQLMQLGCNKRLIFTVSN